MLVTGLSEWTTRAEKRAEQMEKAPKKTAIAPKKKFKEMTGEEAMMWANEAGGGKF